MQQWFTLSDPAIEEALHDVPMFRDFAGLRGLERAAARLEHHPAVSSPDRATLEPFSANGSQFNLYIGMPKTYE